MSELQRIWSQWPRSAQWCWLFTLAQVGSCFIAHAFWPLGPLYKDVNVEEIALFNTARYVLMIPLFLIAMFDLLQMNRIASGSVPVRRRTQRALVISRVCMWEFTVKIVYYTMLSQGYDFAFWNQRCPDYRPIYLTRWLGWSFAIPTLLFMNLYPIMDEQKPVYDVIVRIFPQQAATWAYCWACFLGCIVPDPWMGWWLNILGCVAYVVVIVDEVVLVCDRILLTSQPALKGYSIIVKEAVFIIYTCVYLCSLWGYFTSYACQRFYTVSDISLKSTMATLLFFYWCWDGDRAD
eukprot:Skav218455  [mRNA]  locus=scaffold538:378188:379268:- [translate_table: standard]